MARIQDAKRIYELNKGSLGYDFPEDKTTQRLEVILSLESDRIYVAEYDGIVVGYIHGSRYECTYSESLKNILALAVDEKYRGKSIGRDLLTAIEDWAKEDHCRGVRLVSGINRVDAHKFYLHCGYINTKENKNFFKFFNDRRQ